MREKNNEKRLLMSVNTLKEGIDIKHVLTDFNNALIETDICVAHNITFDKLLILVEAIRNNIRFNFKNQYCTMNNGKDICKIEKIYHYYLRIIAVNYLY